MKSINSSSYLTLKLFFFLFLLIFQIVNPKEVIALNLPDQKFTIALPVTSFSKATAHPSGTSSGSLPVGFAAEYSIFLKPTMSLDGQFEVNLESSEQSIVFMGGSGGTKWFLIGGANENYSDPYLNSNGSSNLNVFILTAFAARQFDFTVLEKDLSITRDKKNPIKGSVFALQLGAGAEMPLFGDVLAGIRLQMVSSFSNPNNPDLTIIEFWITTAYNL